MNLPAEFQGPYYTLYARRGELDPAAPVAAEGNTMIAASVDRVWHVVTDVANWPAIRADIHDVTTDGPLADRSGFTWHTNGVALQSRVARVESAVLLTYCTWAPGLEMVHVYTFEALDHERTRLTIAESMNAPVAAPHIGNAELAQGIASWLAGIKALAETR